jgi:hypothetical protein
MNVYEYKTNYTFENFNNSETSLCPTPIDSDGNSITCINWDSENCVCKDVSTYAPTSVPTTETTIAPISDATNTPVSIATISPLNNNIIN